MTLESFRFAEALLPVEEDSKLRIVWLEYDLVRFGYSLLELMVVGGFGVGSVGFGLRLKWRIPRGRFRRGGWLCILGTQGKSD